MAAKNSEQVVTETFSERSPLADGMSSGAVSAGAGLLVSAIQNSIQTHNKGALGVFTRTGSTIALFSECQPPHMCCFPQADAATQAKRSCVVVKQTTGTIPAARMHLSWDCILTFLQTPMLTFCLCRISSFLIFPAN